MNEDEALAQAARQTWAQLPWWQKGLVGLGAGADAVWRRDVASPALWAAQVLGLAAPGTKARYDAATTEKLAPYDSLPGLAPKALKSFGEIGALLPLGVFADAATEGALARSALAHLPGVSGILPRIIANAGMGAALPGDARSRAVDAGFGAAFPVGGAAMGAAAKATQPALLRQLIRMGVPLPLLYNIFRGTPAAALGVERAVRGATPVIVRRGARPLASAAKDESKEVALEPHKSRVKRAVGARD